MLRNVCGMVVFLTAMPASADAPPNMFRSAPEPIAEEVEWERIRAQPSATSISVFLHQFPDSPHRDDLKRVIRGLESLKSAAPPPTAGTARMSVQDNPSGRSANRPTGALMSRCASIFEHSQLGEGMSDADRAFLSANCH